VKSASSSVPRNNGFTLIEILVSTAVLVLLVLILSSAMNRATQMWRYNRDKAEQFRGARQGFEAITRRLSQATLNTYWDYVDSGDNLRTAANSTTFVPARYVRQSELRIISGLDVAGAWNDTLARPTHAVFFQAPLGFINDSSYSGLENLLNTWGYFIEYGDDPRIKPSFISSAARKRFRLMEMMEPSESLSLYKYTSGPDGVASYKETAWFTDPLALTGTHSVTHVLAENIIALVILPKLSPGNQAAGNYDDASLAPGYFYNSTGYDVNGASRLSTVSDKNLNPTNQLPPVVQLTLVAIDETSAMRMGDPGAQKLLSAIGNGLGNGPLFSQASNFKADLITSVGGLKSLENYLIENKINYRIFTTDISIKTAKWSQEQTN
jgi:uncharacterized protein (TIGR02599 family)